MTQRGGLGDHLLFPDEIVSRLAACYAKRAQAQQARTDNAAAYGEQRVLQDRLAFLSAGMQGSDDVGLPMPFLGLDTVGLSVYGGLLAFAWTQDAPFLMDGATGDLTMYFRGGDGQFFAAYYDTNVLRGTKKLDASGKPVRLLARDPAIAISSMTATVSAGSADDRCTVTIVHPSTTETFKDVPRAADQLAAVLNGRSTTYAYATAATTTRPGATVAHGSQLISADAGGTTTRVGDGTAADDLAGQTVRWHASSAGRAFAFDGQAQRLALPGPSFDGVAAPGDLTVEAWVNPGPRSQASRVLHANAGDAKYALGLAPATMRAALTFNGMGDFLDCGTGIKLDSGDITVELWLKRERITAGSEWMFSHGNQSGGTGHADDCLHLGFVGASRFHFGLWWDDGDYTGTQASDLQWHHWALVYVRKDRLLILYCDGAEVVRQNSTGDYVGVGSLRIGRVADTFANVTVDEVRVWGRARTADQVRANFDRRVTGNEPGLLGYWMFPGGQTADLSGNGNDGKPAGKPTAADSPPRLPAYRALAGIASTFVRSKDVFSANQWGHLAVSYRQDWALRFDGSTYLDVAHDDALNLGGTYTVEAFFQLDTVGLTAQGLLCKGLPLAGLPGWCLGVSNGWLYFLMSSTGKAWMQTIAPSGFQPGTICRVAVVRKSIGVVNGELRDRIRLFANGQQVGDNLDFAASQVATGTAPLEFGRWTFADPANGLKGVLGEVRIWNVAVEDKELCQPVIPRAKGLVARWEFPENAGNTTLDSTGQYRATLHGAKWVRNPDAQASTLQLYHNGTPAASEPLPSSDPFVQAGFGEQQFTLAGRTAGGTLADAFAGTLDEVRVWRTTRGQLDILDRMFTRLDSKPADLLAYYPFDAASTAAGAIVRDVGPRGNDLRAADAQFPRVVASTAPLSGDAAAVRSALTGLVTAFCEGTGATPAVGEYATVQRTTAGVTGIMKRCYSYVRNGTWRLVAGYQVGELVSDWVGQVQRDPQLYGYIEGAPPMPSENLTDASANPSTQDFANASKVTFTQTDKVTRALHSGSEEKRE